MGSPGIRDILTAFSPSMNLIAITAGDGRIKVWDTVKGQVQTEFTDLVGSEESESFLVKPERERGHLSVDYTCMKWFSLEKKKKRKLGGSLLILGTGSGDVLALDISTGNLKWRLRDCHSGGVSSVSFTKNTSTVYTAGCDGMVCKIDFLLGNLLGKFNASTKAISSMAVSPDGEIIATAAGQLKTFTASDHKKMQKFSGHPGNVRCLVFSEDQKYILSSAVGERYIAVWSVGGGKKQSAICALAMDHPAVFIDSKCSSGGGENDFGLYVLAISEVGVCYLWFGQTMEDLRNAKATKITISSEDDISDKKARRVAATIFAAILQGTTKPSSGQVFVTYGSIAKPTFQKISVDYGTDVLLGNPTDGILLPTNQSLTKSKNGRAAQIGVIALDRANAEDALLPIPKVLDSRVKKNERITGSSNKSRGTDEVQAMEVDTEAVCLEDRLRSLGFFSKTNDMTPKSKQNPAILEGINLEAVTAQKKMKEIVMSKQPSDAYKLLGVLVAMWQSGSSSGKHVLPWIYDILVNHSSHVMSEEPATQLLNSLFKACKPRGSAIQPLLQLSGRLQLVTAQINKATRLRTLLIQDNQIDESDDSDHDDVEDVLYEEDDNESELSSDNDS